MKPKYIIFGASTLGKAAIQLLQANSDILYFCDNDHNKHGQSIMGIEVIPPFRLKEIEDDYKVVIASSYAEPISNQLESMGIRDYLTFQATLGNSASWDSLHKSYDLKEINLGHFLSDIQELSIDDLTFHMGGSSILDYMFLKALMVKLGLSTYLEIGTWMGESIAAVAEVAKHCYSVSLPDDDERLVGYFNKVNKKDNFSRYFSKSKSNITHYSGDSAKFDYSVLPERIDLFFIDGDHTFEGVKADTEKVFAYMDPQHSIVVWHDFKEKRNQFVATTVNAIFDALPSHLHGSIYAVDSNMCGIYIPDKYLRHFSFEQAADTMCSYRTEISARINRKN